MTVVSFAVCGGPYRSTLDPILIGFCACGVCVYGACECVCAYVCVRACGDMLKVFSCVYVLVSARERCCCGSWEVYVYGGVAVCVCVCIRD